VTEIGESAFEGCRELTIYTPKGSRAAKYAKENKIRVQYIEESAEGPSSPKNKRRWRVPLIAALAITDILAGLQFAKIININIPEIIRLIANLFQ